MAPLVVTSPFRVPAGPAPAGCCPSTPNRFDNTYWTGSNPALTWNGSAWVFPFAGARTENLDVINSGPNDNWEVAYRPADWSMTLFTPAAPSFNDFAAILRDTTNAEISRITFTPVTGSTTVTRRNAINFGANDISHIEFDQGLYNSEEVQCIAFDCGCTDSAYLDNTYWTVDATTAHLAWNAGNGNWDIGIGSNNLNRWNVINSGPNDNWEVGFRPSAVDIKYTMGSGFYFDTWDFTVRDTSGATIGSVTGVSNGVGSHIVRIPLTFTTFDIGGTGAGAALEVNTFAYSGSDTIDEICFIP